MTPDVPQTKSGRRPKRSVAIDHPDGQPITRADIQFAMLSHIFSDETKAFTDPDTPTNKLSFRDLYVNSILRSPKAKAVFKEKLAVRNVATDFAHLALLINVGRIPATMSFFAEMRTAQRTYHPIPCLQRTNQNLLDAPRIKSVLKSSCLEGESKSGISTPAQLLARTKAGQVPPTTSPNLLFIFANHSAQIGRDHLPDIEFLDLFLSPSSASSHSRARIFLWLCYHYHEAPSVNSDEDYDGDAALPNPFSDAGSPGEIPRLVPLTAEEAAAENADPEDEMTLAERLLAQRKSIVRDHRKKESAKESKALASTSGENPSPSKPRGQRVGTSAPAKRKARVVKDEEADELYLQEVPDEVGFPLRSLHQERRSSLHDPLSPLRPSRSPPHFYRYSPYKRSRPRTMLQHAWDVIESLDPLADSDEDDEDDRYDQAERLAIISRVRGRSPTPEPAGLRPIPMHLGPWHDDLLV